MAENFSPALLVSIIGLCVSILLFIISNIIENCRRRRELRRQSRPILIDCTKDNDSMIADMDTLNFSTKGAQSISIIGVLKNTDNAVALIDYIETKTKRYSPDTGFGVDKNTEFMIRLQLVEGETLEYFRIVLHDIYGIHYYYEARFLYKSEFSKSGRIRLLSCEPHRLKKKDFHKELKEKTA